MDREEKPHNPIMCLYCGYRGYLIWVHGHGQCARCGINTHECCSGEQCLPETNPHFSQIILIVFIILLINNELYEKLLLS